MKLCQKTDLVLLASFNAAGICFSLTWIINRWKKAEHWNGEDLQLFPTTLARCKSTHVFSLLFKDETSIRIMVVKTNPATVLELKPVIFSPPWKGIRLCWT